MLKSTLLLCSILFCAMRSLAIPTEVVPFARLSEEADVVAVFRISSFRTEQGVVEVHGADAYCLKGVISNGAIVIRYRSRAATWEAFEPFAGRLALAFLKVGETPGTFDVLLRFGQSTRFRDAFLPITDDDFELAKQSALDDRDPRSLSPAKLLGTLAGISPGGVFAQALWEMRNSRSVSASELSTVSSALLSRPNPSAFPLGLALTIHLSPADGLRLVRESRNFAATGSFEESLLRAAIGSVANPDPVVVSRLGDLARSLDCPYRVEAAASLFVIHTAEAVRELAPLLDEDHPELVARAVGGLACFANNVPIGGFQPAAGEAPYRTAETIKHSVMSEDAIKRDRAYYVGFWKEWWDKNKDTALTQSR